MKGDTSLITCPESWRAPDESVEFLGIEANIIEEPWQQLVESRGIDPRHEVLQIFLEPIE